jgi:thiaminase/transcriptional activator TenA
MSGRFSEELRQKLDAVWEAQHRHPFVRGLGDGTLDSTRFQSWLRQSYLYLIEYARLVSLAAARAPDVETTRWMITLANGVLQNEMLLHQAYAVEFGLTREELEAGEKLPTTRAYTDHLFRIAGMGAYVELVAALMPCVCGHAEIGQRLARESGRPDPRYSRWIDLYSGPSVAKIVRQSRELLDRLAGTAGPRALAQAEDSFAISSRYEWMFWQMCWQGENWPDKEFRVMSDK